MYFENVFNSNFESTRRTIQRRSTSWPMEWLFKYQLLSGSIDNKFSIWIQACIWVQFHVLYLYLTAYTVFDNLLKCLTGLKWKLTKLTKKWQDVVYEFNFPISRLAPIFLWQTFSNYRFLWVNNWSNSQWDIFEWFSNTVLIRRL